MKSNYRRCISCRRVGPKESFWRVVRVYPSHQVQLDQGMGRSAYICPDPACLQAAQKKNRLGKALKAKVPPEIYPTLWQRLQSSQNRFQTNAIATGSQPHT
ncbi:YlxR family protein [Geitlerinema sp. PCC 9228]|uniref:YlxR family protein n=1 Tax=Geitlerinema sp. PCC 9228 TaxID=111611 RepID=UPI0008F9CF8F|nr:YlxR family protein [Geitlerinema sp. PCC 9228]